MDQSQTICLPSLPSDREMSQEIRAGSGERNDSNSAILTQSVLVSDPVGQISRCSLDTAKLQPDNNQPEGRDISNGSSEQLKVSRLQSFRNTIQGHEISDDSFKLISAAWRSSTEKAYSLAWGKWIVWCNQAKVDPLQTSIGPVLNFLTAQFQEGKQYSTLNSYRSALPATMPEIDGKPVGQHPMVVRLLQGMFNERPPALRYQEVWDVGLVVKHIQDGLTTTDLSLNEMHGHTYKHTAAYP